MQRSHTGPCQEATPQIPPAWRSPEWLQTCPLEASCTGRCGTGYPEARGRGSSSLWGEGRGCLAPHEHRDTAQHRGEAAAIEMEGTSPQPRAASSLPLPRLSPALGSSSGTAAASAASHLSPVAPRRGTNAGCTCGERRGKVRAAPERPAGSLGRLGSPAGPHLAASGATLQHLPVLAPAGDRRGAALFLRRADAEVGGEERGRELHGRGTRRRGQHAAQLPVGMAPPPPMASPSRCCRRAPISAREQRGTERRRRHSRAGRYRPLAAGGQKRTAGRGRGTGTGGGSGGTGMGTGRERKPAGEAVVPGQDWAAVLGGNSGIEADQDRHWRTVRTGPHRGTGKGTGNCFPLLASRAMKRPCESC